MNNKYSIEDIGCLLNKQLHNFFVGPDVDVEYVLKANTRCLKGFSVSKGKYLDNLDSCINPEHSLQWAVFLYYCSNELYIAGEQGQAAQVYYLNKIMHSCDWFYEAKLPDYFYGEHFIGSILGRAGYGEYLYVYQGTTIGGNVDLLTGQIDYPCLGDYIILYSDAKILGKCKIGNHVVFSANSYVLNTDIPSNSIVFGQSPNLCIKEMSEEEVRRHFNRRWK